MNKPIRISPSQWQLFKLCNRKGAFAYIDGLREPGSRATTLGTRVHTIHEDYNIHATVPDPDETWSFSQYLLDEIATSEIKRVAEAERIVKHDPKSIKDTKVFYPGRIALTMMPDGFYPAPGVGHVEDRFEWEYDGILWNGLIDWHDRTGDLITIIDHKTSSDPLKWGKLGDDDDGDDARKLRNDPQAIIYARAMLGRYGSGVVSLNWNYGCTDAKPNKARMATAFMRSGEVYAKFENEIMPFARKIRDWRLAQVEPLALDPNPNACFAYHKQCPHASACNLSTSERLSTIMAGNAMLDNLLKETGNAPATPTIVPGDQVNPPEAGIASIKSIVEIGGVPIPTPDPVVPIETTQIPEGAGATPEAGKHPKPKPKPRPKPAKVAQVVTGYAGALDRLAILEGSDPKLADMVREKVAADLAQWVLNG